MVALKLEAWPWAFLPPALHLLAPQGTSAAPPCAEPSCPVASTADLPCVHIMRLKCPQSTAGSLGLSPPLGCDASPPPWPPSGRVENSLWSRGVRCGPISCRAYAGVCAVVTPPAELTLGCALWSHLLQGLRWGVRCGPTSCRAYPEPPTPGGNE